MLIRADRVRERHPREISLRKVIRGCLLLSIAMLAAPVALAQTWPTKPVRFINPFPAGGGVDVFARPIAAKLTPALGQQIIVENLSGAGAQRSTSEVGRPAPLS